VTASSQRCVSFSFVGREALAFFRFLPFPAQGARHHHSSAVTPSGTPSGLTAIAPSTFTPRAPLRAVPIGPKSLPPFSSTSVTLDLSTGT